VRVAIFLCLLNQHAAQSLAAPGERVITWLAVPI
jgi:hypothetical protein